ncbi:FK506-binding protein [Phycisphaerales bacterium]|nr:FK506-binding protein [Phycisphaerales bacterium]
MRPALLALVVAGLVGPAFAFQPEKPVTPPPTGTPETPPAAPVPETPPMPKAIPVPDMPAINRVELEGGIILEDMKIGDGYEVKADGAVVAYYHGTLKEGGKKFDSSFERGEPATFALKGVIPGWQKGVPGMKVGGIRRLTIPAALGYGARGAGADIPPNSDLIFVIQLVDALQIEDIEVGEGDAAAGQCVPVTAHTIKDKDGKEVAKADAAHPYVWIPGEMLDVNSQFDAFQTAIAGMKVGGKRKIIIPKEMNNAPPQLGVTRPTGVPLTIEAELVAVRNLPGR